MAPPYKVCKFMLAFENLGEVVIVALFTRSNVCHDTIHLQY